MEVTAIVSYIIYATYGFIISFAFLSFSYAIFLVIQPFLHNFRNKMIFKRLAFRGFSDYRIVKRNDFASFISSGGYYDSMPFTIAIAMIAKGLLKIIFKTFLYSIIIILVFLVLVHIGKAFLFFSIGKISEVVIIYWGNYVI